MAWPKCDFGSEPAKRVAE